MSNPPISSIEAHFESVPDPRRDDCRTPHKLLNIVVITICAVICGADNWVAVQSFGNAKYILYAVGSCVFEGSRNGA